jgi:CheY-like chemotaxis protein/predicted transcriptional regulator
VSEESAAMSLPKILNAIADEKSWTIFQSIAYSNLESDVILRKTNLTPKQYYSRISEMTESGLVRRQNKKYCLTSLGKVVYGSQIITQNALNNHWRLKAVDSFDSVPEREREQLIKELLKDKILQELLTEEKTISVKSDMRDRFVRQHPNEFNLMLVEDEEDVLMGFKSVLQSRGYNVDAFTSSYEALKHFIELDRPYYHLVIADIRMRGMNGIQLYQKLKSIDNDVRIVFITALDAAEELLSILPNLRPSQILRKPINNKDFMNVIDRALCKGVP